MSNEQVQRSDTALTTEIAGAIVERLKEGGQITKRGSKHLLLDYLPGQEKIPTSTYTSWLRRKTVPIGSKDGKALSELVEEAREGYREHFQKDMLRRAEGVLSETLNMPIAQSTVLKRINETGQIEHYNGEVINPRLAEVRQRAAEFALRKLDSKTYGDSTQMLPVESPISFSELRRIKERRDELRAEETLRSSAG